MKIVCVSGGSYKSFYLNCFLNLNKCDLLVFNFGIIYDYDMIDEAIGKGIVSKEILMLSKSLGCQVVAGVNLISKGKSKKGFVCCDGEKLVICSVFDGCKIHIKNKDILVGVEWGKQKAKNKIILSNKRIFPNLESCSKDRFYIFCDNFGVNIVQNKKLKRKFCKYSKFILK